MIKNKNYSLSMLAFLLAIFNSACTTTNHKYTVDERTYNDITRSVEKTLTQFKNTNPELDVFFQSAYGYAVYPAVYRLGFGAGGAYGSGYVYEQNQLIGRSKVWQFMYGLVYGGQSYSKIIFFKNQQSLDLFKNGTFEFVGHAGLALLNLGASSLPAFTSDVAMYSLTKYGLIIELTPGGMGFDFTPLQVSADNSPENQHYASCSNMSLHVDCGITH